MAQINNSNLTKEMIDVARLHPAVDKIPSRLADSVVPVIDVNPKHARVCDVVSFASRTSTGPGGVYTTPTDRDFFLVAIQHTLTADATADNTNSFVDILLPNGDPTRIQIITINKQTTTAVSGLVQSISFPVPIKIARGSAIRHSSTFTVGTCNYTTSVIGFTVLT